MILLLDLLSNSVNTSVRINWYTRMYLLMVVVTGLDWIIFSYLEHKLDQGPHIIKALNIAATTFLIFLMTWGSVISLMDQSIYGNITVFMVNILVGTVMFTMKHTRIHVSQLIAAAVLMIGLPYFQSSGNILVGHYINASIFMVFCWVIAKTNYNNYVQNYINQRLIEEKSAQLAQINENLQTTNEQLLTVSSLDALTGIPNRRKLAEFLNEKWDTAVKDQFSLSIMMIDIDFFKLYNDCNGHLAGDHCLQTVANVLSKCLRAGQDFVARFGGEEFLFVATGISKEEASLLGERIREEIESLCLEHKSSSISPYVTVSVGISWLVPGRADLLAEIVQLADQAMYQAKHGGRNRVIMAL
ncbi:MAG TPA: diguanylate cyclase [Syntrophomonadaceae bacterium]|nr:diguanylate cyclase [Syntrophomonadaceae bacterium]